MGFLDFFKRNKKTKTETVRSKKPSPEQILFTETVLEIINPTVEKFGFSRNKIEIEKYSSTIIWRNNDLYIKIQSSTYPTDYPYFYNIILGEGNSDNFLEYDWNSISLWKLKSKVNPKLKAKEYSFPVGDKVIFSIENANKELLKYGQSFLNGDIALFLEVRSEQNKKREPYKIHTPDENGKYVTTYDQISEEQKKKFS